MPVAVAIPTLSSFHAGCSGNPLLASFHAGCSGNRCVESPEACHCIGRRRGVAFKWSLLMRYLCRINQLMGIEFGIDAVVGDEFAMTAVFDNQPLLHHQNPVGAPYRR